MGQRFWACHNHWVGHSHFGTEAAKLLRSWLFWANFEVHSGLLTDTKTWWWPCECTTLFGPHLVQECHFRAPWSRTNTKKWRGAAPLRTPSHTPPLKFPPVVYMLVPRRGEKTAGFFTVFVFFNLAQYHSHLTCIAFLETTTISLISACLRKSRLTSAGSSTSTYHTVNHSYCATHT